MPLLPSAASSVAATSLALGESIAAANLQLLKSSGEVDLSTFSDVTTCDGATVAAYSAPFTLFAKWYSEARAIETPWANAVNVATVASNGRPSSRTVLMQKFNENEGFGFYTNYSSRKGRDIEGNSYVALTFYWPQLARQVRIEGKATKATSEASDAYFASRPRGHQISAWSSVQSESLPSADEFTKRIQETEVRFPQGTTVPRPPHCGMYFVQPDGFEFWCEGADRRHQRLTFAEHKTTAGDAVWGVDRLFP
jgi:pyridoxamine 5'-phosphate oxidase